MTSPSPPPTLQEKTPCADLTKQVIRTGRDSIGQGGFSDVYKGIWTDPATRVDHNVAIKVLRGLHLDPEQLRITTRRLNRESYIWSSLSHDHILKFLGVSRDVAASPSLISPFCDAGSVTNYLRKEPSANKSRIIFQIAQGLEYLHSRGVIHGDLKCNNVLIDNEGRPLICDFGRSKIIGKAGHTTGIGTDQHLAPELLEPPKELEGDALDNWKPVLTKKADVYSFGIVGFEILTGEMPFQGIQSDAALRRKVKQGIVVKDQDCLGKYPVIFKVLEGCWVKQPESRSKMPSVVLSLSPA